MHIGVRGLITISMPWEDFKILTMYATEKRLLRLLNMGEGDCWHKDKSLKER